MADAFRSDYDGVSIQHVQAARAYGVSTGALPEHFLLHFYDRDKYVVLFPEEIDSVIRLLIEAKKEVYGLDYGRPA